MISFKLLMVLATLGVAYSQNAVAPVLIWGNHPSIDKMTSNLAKVSSNNIEDWITKPASEDEDTHVLVGILESLSLPDLFKTYGDVSVFSNVQSSMSNSKYKKILFQTNVQSKRMHDAFDESVSGVQDLVATSDSMKIHVIKIAPKGEDLSETLKMSDNIMHKACKEHASLYNSYICVMTGSSGAGGEETDHVRIARCLKPPRVEPLSSKSPPNSYFVPGFVSIDTTSKPLFQFLVGNQSKEYNLTKIDKPTESNNTLIVYFQDKDNSSPKIRLAFTFISNSTYWSLEHIGYGDDAKSEVVLKPPEKIFSSSEYPTFITPSKVVFQNYDKTYNLTFCSLQVDYDVFS
ncbi:uncharacterized protein LOC135841090 [Planococcus citri]|uniref:uncharacterized protein LOC135841090 n=1 Tax=Planococcus citri TaxID=170843 RepID=UPI0031F7635D